MLRNVTTTVRTTSFSTTDKKLALLPRTDLPAGVASPSAGGGAQRGDDSCVAPAALRAVLASFKTGGMTGAEKAKVKAGKKLAAKDAEDRRAAEGMSAEVIVVICSKLAV